MQVLWLLSMVASTIYTFSWDVLMDWGLGWRKHRMLRERRMFRKTWIYYGACRAARALLATSRRDSCACGRAA